MTLPLVKRKDAAGTLPNGESLQKAIEVVGTRSESATYFSEQYLQRLNRSGKNAEFADLVASVEKYPHDVRMQENDSGSEWDGVQPQSVFQTFQANLVQEAQAALPSGKQVIFGYTIDDASNYLGGYLENNQRMEALATESMDKHFNGWLATKNKVKDDGVIYETTNAGQIQKNEKGESMRANPQEMRAMIEDQQTGFVAFMKKQDDSIALLTHYYTDAEIKELSQLESSEKTTSAGASSR